jgi:hypothetical protein
MDGGGSFAAYAGMGFGLFFFSLLLGACLTALISADWAFGIAFGFSFAALLVVAIVSRRGGLLTGWLVGFMLAAAVVGCWWSTCGNGWG